MIISIPEFSENPANPVKVVRREPDSNVDAGQVTGQVTEEVTGEVARLLGVMSDELKRIEIQRRLGLKHEDHFREVYLLSSLQMGLIQMTIPDKPKSRLQKHRLTARGQTGNGPLPVSLSRAHLQRQLQRQLQKQFASRRDTR